jgi:uncharacterized protein YaeQ
MALTSTIYRFVIALSNVDRGIYESLDLRVACHPSEALPHLVTRVLAFAFLHEEGLAFSKGGLSDSDAPALAIHSLDGQLRAWIEIGVPSADRLHKASKAAARVVVITHKNPKQLLAQVASREIHRKQALELYALDEPLVAALAAAVDKTTHWAVTFSDGQVYVEVNGASLIGSLERLNPRE